ncbi:MAG: hypothetical protein R2860_04000 [Desulfobacterales bacterium]
MYFVTRSRRFRKLVKGISLLEGYFPYITRTKVFENAKSMKLIEKYTNCTEALPFRMYDENGELLQKDITLKVLGHWKPGWGGSGGFWSGWKRKS